MGVFRPQQHLCVGIIQFLECLFVSPHVRVVDLCHPFVGRFDFDRTTIIGQVGPLEFQHLQTPCLMPGQPRKGFPVRPDAAGLDILAVILVDKAEGCVAP